MEAITEARTSAFLLTVDQAAIYLDLTRSTLNKWRCQGKGPSFIKRWEGLFDTELWI